MNMHKAANLTLWAKFPEKITNMLSSENYFLKSGEVRDRSEIFWENWKQQRKRQLIFVKHIEYVSP